jgi:hypothetical protein
MPGLFPVSLTISLCVTFASRDLNRNRFERRSALEIQHIFRETGFIAKIAPSGIVFCKDEGLLVSHFSLMEIKARWVNILSAKGFLNDNNHVFEFIRHLTHERIGWIVEPVFKLFPVQERAYVKTLIPTDIVFLEGNDCLLGQELTSATAADVDQLEELGFYLPEIYSAE